MTKCRHSHIPAKFSVLRGAFHKQRVSSTSSLQPLSAFTHQKNKNSIFIPLYFGCSVPRLPLCPRSNTSYHRDVQLHRHAASSVASQHQHARQISAPDPGHSGAGCRLAGFASLGAPRIECKSHPRGYAGCYCCVCCRYCVVVELAVCTVGVVAVQGM